MKHSTILFITLAAPAQLVAQGEDRSLAEGVYTEAQAARGLELMEQVCSECHEPSEFDQSFMSSWEGADVAELFDLVSSTMPEDSPGSLRPQQYVDALAYIFKLNGVPAGNEELKPDLALLRHILIER